MKRSIFVAMAELCKEHYWQPKIEGLGLRPASMLADSMVGDDPEDFISQDEDW